MADNVTITPGAGATVAADDITGVMYQRVKLSLGADGTAVDAVAGAGVVGAGVQRTTLASDDPAVVALAAIQAKLIATPANAANQASLIAAIGAPGDAAGINTLMGQMKTIAAVAGSSSPTVVTAGVPSALTAQIANAASLSGAIAIQGKLVALKTPAGWTAAPLTFDGSMDGGVTYAPIYDGATERSIPSANIGATRMLTLHMEEWLAYTHIKLRSGPFALPVAQPAARDFQVALAG